MLSRVRGREQRLLWVDGRVAGDGVLIERLRHAVPDLRFESAARLAETLERVVGDPVRVRYLDPPEAPRPHPHSNESTESAIPA